MTAWTVIQDNLPALIIAVPLLGAFIAPLLRGLGNDLRNLFTVVITGLAFVLVIVLALDHIEAGLASITYGMGSPQPLGPQVAPIGLPVRILLVIDSFGLLMAGLISGCAFLSAVYSRRYMDEPGNEKFYTLLMLLTTGLLGIALTGDIFNLFVFLEIASVSAYGLVAYYSDRPEPVEAALKYMVASTLATALILLGIAILYGEFGTLTMAQIALFLGDGSSYPALTALGLILAGLSLKAGLVPTHMWVADAHATTPTPISMMLSGIVTKTGVYAILRFTFTIFGAALAPITIGWLLAFIGSATILVAMPMAILQDDFKRLLAYSSVGQVGYILLAVGVGFAVISTDAELALAAVAGGVFHLINHTLFKALLFLVAGAVLREAGSIDMRQLGGLARAMPITTWAFLVGAASIIGVPPFSGFVSKWIIYQTTAIYNPLLALVAVIGTLFTLGAYFKVFQQVFTGKTRTDVRESPYSMLTPIVILAILTLLIGVFPAPVFNEIVEPVSRAILDPAPYISSALGGI